MSQDPYLYTKFIICDLLTHNWKAIKWHKNVLLYTFLFIIAFT